jgi:hypothetical protein
VPLVLEKSHHTPLLPLCTQRWFCAKFINEKASVTCIGIFKTAFETLFSCITSTNCACCKDVKHPIESELHGVFYLSKSSRAQWFDNLIHITPFQTLVGNKYVSCETLTLASRNCRTPPKYIEIFFSTSGRENQRVREGLGYGGGLDL